MVFANLRTEERVGLGIALGLHVALAAALMLQPETRKALPPVQKMTVNLAPDVGLESTAPDPVPQSRMAEAPTLAAEPVPPAEPQPQPQPQPLPPAPVQPPKPAAAAPPKPTPAIRPVPRPVAAAPRTPVPAPRATQRPVTRPAATRSDARRRPDAPSSTTRTAPATRPAGGSRIGADFLPGAGTSTTTRETRTPASQIGASAKASLGAAIAREIKPKWTSPQGADVEQLVTILSFNLNPDGSLAGTPRVVRQDGINDTNRPQASRHAEQAIRAVQLAAPFDLPEEYYEAWKRVTSFRFDRKL